MDKIEYKGKSSMKNTQVKRGLASVVAVSVGITTLIAPINLFAAGRQNIRFDLGIYTKFEGVSLENLVYTDQSFVRDQYPDTTKYPGDTGENGQAQSSVDSDGTLELPWWNVDWDSYKASVLSGTPTEKPSPVWGVNDVRFDFDGYALDKWVESTGITENKVNKVARNFPYREITYIAKYVSDGTEYSIKTRYESAEGVNAPLDSNVDKVDVSKKVLVSYQAPILNIPGYKATLDDADIKIFEPKTTNLVNGKTYIDYDWEKTDNNYLRGKTFNKDMQVTYKYVVDNNKSFNVDAVHIILDAEGNESNTTNKRILLNAEQSITGVGPLTDLITPKQGSEVARYVLVTEDGAGLEKAPSIKKGNVANLSNHISGYTGDFDDNYNLTGVMPNQSILVEYVYKPNPNYKLNINVKYVDEKGKALTKTVVDNVGIDNIGGLYEEATNVIKYELNPNTSTQAPYPDLTSFGYTTPTYAVTSNQQDAGAVEQNGDKLDINLIQTSYDITVTYPKNQAKWGTVLFNNSGNLTLEDRNNAGVEYDAGINPVEAEKNDADKLLITKELALEFPVIAPAVGYDIDGFYVGETKVIDENGKLLIPNYELESSDNNYVLTAKVKKNKNWKSYVFTYDEGNNGSMADYPKTVEIYPLDESGSQRVINWAQINPDSSTIEPEFVGLVPIASAEPGYIIKWYDDQGTEITDTDDIATYPDGAVFTAKAVYDSPLVLNTPNVQGVINQNNGSAQIVATAINPDPSVWYIITDIAGNVIKKIRVSDLNANNRIIEDVTIIPDKEYDVYEVAPIVNINIGDNISEVADIDKSHVSKVHIPVVNEPDVTTDPNQTNKNRAIFSPVTQGMDYAVIDDEGNIIMPWTKPSGIDLIVDGLNPNKTYTVVIKPNTDISLEKDKLPGMDFVSSARALNNRLILVNPKDIEVESPLDIDFNNVPTGAVVKLKAKSINDNGDVFAGSNAWELVMGAPRDIQTDGNTVYQFVMPKGNVVIKAHYGAVKPAVWHPATSSDAIGKLGDIAVVNPEIDEAGNYRVSIVRDKASFDDTKNIDLEEADDYTGISSITVKIEKKDSVSGLWEEYIDPDLKLETYIDTGLLSRGLKTYVMHEMPAGQDPVRVSGEYENIINSASYSGLYKYDFTNGLRYVFGYIEPAGNIIDIKSNIDNSTIAKIKVEYMESLSKYSDQYVSLIQNMKIGLDGLVWTYKGLSSKSDLYEEYQDTEFVSSDKEIFAYYINDKDRRDRVEDALEQLISKLDLNDPNVKVAVDVLNKTIPRKATADELQIAIDQLANIFGNNHSSNNGSVGKGSSPSSSSAGFVKISENNTNLYRSYTVGIHGNWVLVNPQKHMWKFERNLDGHVIGWTNLSYTHNGITKIETYHFSQDGIMDSGWYKDENGKWYYLSRVHDGFFGKLIKGWHKDVEDGRWYYLTNQNGEMATGWRKIGEKWYYFHPKNNTEDTWRYNVITGKWEYKGNINIRPLGSMYVNERTPDGYFVNEKGEWVENK